VDFKGHFRTGDGTKVHPLTLTDAFSRYLLRCQILLDPRTAEVRDVFESAFREHGLPVAIRSDNGPPFASTGVGGLTELSVWWLKLGIRHERIEPGHPEQNGRHERMHRTLKNETASPPARTPEGQQGRSTRFLRYFNFERPHEGIGMRCPADLYVPSDRLFEEAFGRERYPFDLEHALVDDQGAIRWKGRVLRVGRALRGQLVELKPTGSRRWSICFGPVLLGEYDERRSKQRLVSPSRKPDLSSLFAPNGES
jgi:hypothetical protein